MTEILDIYDDNMQYIGTKPRPDVHRDGDWHRVFHCWVIFRDEAGADWIIMQKRGVDKATYPGYLDVSAAGHYAAGETVRDGIRELHEELGLTQHTFDDLIRLGWRVSSARYEQVIDREVADVFFLICDQPLAAYVYQQEELAGLVSIPTEPGIELALGNTEQLEVPAVGFDTPTISIQQADFIPSQDAYFAKICTLAQRCLDGERKLFV